MTTHQNPCQSSSAHPFGLFVTVCRGGHRGPRSLPCLGGPCLPASSQLLFSSQGSFQKFRPLLCWLPSVPEQGTPLTLSTRELFSQGSLGSALGFLKNICIGLQGSKHACFHGHKMCTLLRRAFPPEEISSFFLSRLKEGGKEWGKVNRDELKVTVANSFPCPKKSFLSQLVYYGTQPCILSGYNQIQLSLRPFALYYVVVPPALAKKRPSLQMLWKLVVRVLILLPHLLCP